ncbi:hypothetical protein HH310_11890 [Actinoplanes sp. TBRC 11911]|uniref:hypothetical protein n=1 Tax=Actinoplanes sp. TBRC 11911 TaxID=2729386 RepID=UPI00145C65A0|nr:hypothetical protein [Actinoplanes sp. TBRC 11911]NMO51892.1 hypothetical protein [Actinoplanes sp. TBRC 11911]
MGMRAALCECESTDFDVCAVLAVGRCHQCGRAFCESHRGDARATLCGACRGFDARRAAHAERERRNVEAAKRAEAFRREERHAAAVAAREEKTGWAVLREEVEVIDAWLASSGPGGRAVSSGKALVAGALGIAAAAVMVPIARTGEWAFVLGILALVLVWSGWTVTRRYRQHQRRRWRLERNRLLMARGCGVPGCAMCARDA